MDEVDQDMQEATAALAEAFTKSLDRTEVEDLLDAFRRDEVHLQVTPDGAVTLTVGGV